MKITKETKLFELIKYPSAVEILQKKGLHCLGCFFANQESIEQGCKAHGMKKKEIEEIIKEINSVIKKE